MPVVGNFLLVLPVVSNIFRLLSLVGKPHSHPLIRWFNFFESKLFFFTLYTLSFSFQQLLVVRKFIFGDIIPDPQHKCQFFSQQVLQVC